MSKKSSKKFACIRIAAVRNLDFGTFGAKDMPGKKTGLAGYLAHDFRFMSTPNAKKDMIAANLVFCKKTKWKALKATHENLRKIGIKNAFSIPARAEKTLRRLKVQVQKNSIVATALMLTISPEVLRDGDKSKEVNKEILGKYIQASLKFLRNRFGNRVLLACLHMDELNPHISAYVLPVIKKEMKKSGRSKNGEKGKKREARVETRLGHTEMFTRDKLIYEMTAGTEIEVLKEVIPGTCSILQDEYANALQKEGLDVIRGVKAEPEKRRLKYVTTKRLYERMMRGVKNAEEAIAKFKELLPDEQEEMLRQWIALATESDGYRIQRDHYQIQAAGKDENIAKLDKKIADSMRELSVAEVIEAVTGIKPIPHESNGNTVVRHGANEGRRLKIDCEFRLPNGQHIGVENARNSFENLTPELPFLGEGAGRISGSGSINAVMYITGCTFDSAMARLANLFGDGAIQKAAVKKIDEELAHKKNSLLIQDNSRWPELLLKLRAMNIREEVISQAKTEKAIAANREGQILFSKQQWGGGGADSAPGILVVDPAFPEIPVMEVGEDDAFILMGGSFASISVDSVKKIETDCIICATPFDALAIKSHANYRSAHVVAVGKNPGKSTKEAIEFFREQSPNKLYFADNLLAHGKKIAEWLAEHLAGIIRTIPLPANCRSWIEAHTAPEPGDSPDVNMKNTPPMGNTKQAGPTKE
jgi:hypothetical protein